MSKRLRFRRLRPYKTYNGISEHDGQWAGETYIFHLRLPRARQTYDCGACGEAIPTGMRHVAYVTRNVEGPGWETWRIHGECFEDGGPMFYTMRPDWRWDEA